MMAKQLSNGKVFNERKNKDYKEDFLNYLQNLPTESLPFGCLYLKILQENIKLINKGYPSETYAKGTLICIDRTKSSLNPLCKIESILTLDNGDLAFFCNRGSKERHFKVKLVNFKENGK